MSLFNLHKVTPIAEFSKKLEILVRGKLWLQVLIGMITGLAVGIAIGPDFELVSPATADVVAEWLALPGYLFLRLIKMILIPLVVASIIRGLGGSTDAEGLRKMGLKFAGYVVCTTTVATAIGIAVARIIQPGKYVSVEGVDVTEAGMREAVALPSLGSLPAEIVNIIPDNPLAAAASGELLGVVIFAVTVGVALAIQKNKQIEPLLLLTDGVLEVTMTIVRWAMMLAPFAVFGLTAQMAIRTGTETILGLGVYVGSVLLGLILLTAFYLMLLLLIRGISPVWFLKRILPAQLLAFSTSSSAAVMPLSFKIAQEELEVEQSTTEIILPLGATINMDGTALYQSVAMLFLAQISGIELALAEYVVLIATLVLSSIGAPSTPGVGMAILASVAASFGIPTAGIALVMGVDRILDMARTTVNVTGDLTACMIFSEDKRGGFLGFLRRS